jgi:hypothetical protein
VTIESAGNFAFNGTWTVASVLRSGTEVSRASRIFTFSRTTATISAVSGGNVISSVVNAVDGSVLGGAGGSSTHVLTTGQLAAHTHSADHSRDSPSGGSGDTADHNHGPGSTYSLSHNGGDGPHNNVQPTLILNYIIKV